MRTTSLRYPKRSKFIQIHEWQLEATGGNQPAAALLSVLEYRHNYLIENREFEKAIAAALKAQKKQAPLEMRGWQFYSDAQLEDLLMLWKKEAILTGVRKLVELGFVETEPPEVLKGLFKTGRQKWFKFRADLVNVFLDDFNARQYASAGAPEPNPAAKETPEEKRQRKLVSMAELEREAGESLMAQAREVFNDWRVVLDTPQSVEDAKRLKLAVARLKEGFTAARLKLATRGVVCLDYNMGFNPDGREHWGFDLIFRDSAHVEKYERAALEKGFTAENLENLKISRLNRKITEAEAAPAADLTAYRETAQKIAFGLANYAPQAEIIEEAESLMRADFELSALIDAVLRELAAVTVVDASTRRRAAALCEILLGERK